MKDKFVYKVFHLNGDSESYKRRDILFNNIKPYLDNHFSELDTPTIRISNQEEYDNWINNNPDFYINGKGCTIPGFEGWRYGEVGIWASNFTAWKNFLESDYDYLILMEDDIVHNNDFAELLVDYVSELPEGWDMFSFFCPDGEFNKYDASHDIGKPHVCKTYQDWSMLCYVLSKKGAEKALKSMEPAITLSLDWHFFRQTATFNEYTVKPNAKQGCRLDGIESTFQTTQDRNFLNGNIRP